jgi:uncharacterized protein (DUF2062 family)
VPSPPVPRLRHAALALLRLNASPHGIALGFSLGFGLSLFPIPFLGMFVALALAPFCGASLPAVYAGTAVVNPLTGAAFYFGELWLGTRLTGDALPSWSQARDYDWRAWWSLCVGMLPSFLLGALTSMLCASLLCYPTLRWLAGKYGVRGEAVGEETSASENGPNAS